MELKLLLKEEFLKESELFKYIDVNGHEKEVELDKDSLCFTYCQIPIIYQLSIKEGIEIVHGDSNMELDSLLLSHALSKKIFERTGEIEKLHVYIKENKIR